MKTRKSTALPRLIPLLLLLPIIVDAQVPVDNDGYVIDSHASSYKRFSTEPASGDEGIPLLARAELQELVGPIALYPDDLLAIVLPASTYPLQVVQAARFLEDLQSDPTLNPDPDWDDSIVALVNYPEALALLNDDLDWTWRLGEAVVAQQADVLSAVTDFRDQAYAAGNLKSDGYQTVSRDEGVIEIMPVTRDIMYVPYYEPERVVRYQTRPVYHYYPEPYPVYYYPYPAGYSFPRHHFWGVTTAFGIGWTSSHLRVFHHSYGGHPYFGVPYWDRWWYRRPPISVHNTVYVDNSINIAANRHARGDTWRSNRNARLRYSDQRITRNTFEHKRREYGNTPPRTRVPAHRDSAVTPRGNIVQPRGSAVARRDQLVQPREPIGVSGQRPTSRRSLDNHGRQRVALVEGRRPDARPRSVPRPSTNAAQQSPSVRTNERRTEPARSSERRAQPASSPPARASERRKAESGGRRSQTSPRQNAPVRDQRRRR